MKPTDNEKRDNRKPLDVRRRERDLEFRCALLVLQSPVVIDAASRTPKLVLPGA